MNKPTPEQYGFIGCNTLDGEPCGWYMEGGEDAYVKALEAWEKENVKRKEDFSNGIVNPLADLAREINYNNRKNGIWDEWLSIPNKMQSSGLFTEKEIIFVEKAFKAQRLMLMVSELSEALEADRKDLNDDKLTDLKGHDVELIDAFMRIFDDFGSRNYPIDEVLHRKLEYNKTRPYKHGKTF